MNTTKITANNITECIYGTDLYLPCELQLDGTNYVMRFENEDEFDGFNFESFINDFNFAINVAISEGWDSMEQHLKLNGHNVRFIGLLSTNDFLAKLDDDVAPFLNLDLFTN